jgi:hypothetical protein
MKLMGKRFIFATIMGVCASVTAVLLKYDGDTYLKIIALVTSVYTLGQTMTDRDKNGNK